MELRENCYGINIKEAEGRVTLLSYISQIYCFRRLSTGCEGALCGAFTHDAGCWGTQEGCRNTEQCLRCSSTTHSCQVKGSADSCVNYRKHTHGLYRGLVSAELRALRTLNWWLGSSQCSLQRSTVFKTEQNCVNPGWDHMVTQGNTDVLLVNNILHYWV